MPGGTTIATIDPNDYRTASDAFGDRRAESDSSDCGSRGIELTNTECGAIADIRYHERGWEPFQIKSRSKHDEGWNQHHWL